MFIMVGKYIAKNKQPVIHKEKLKKFMMTQKLLLKSVAFYIFREQFLLNITFIPL